MRLHYRCHRSLPVDPVTPQNERYSAHVTDSRCACVDLVAQNMDDFAQAAHFSGKETACGNEVP